MTRVSETIVAVEKQEELHISALARARVYARLRASACARVCLLTQYTTRRHIVICGLSGSIIFFDITS
jgi:hypothetical protein